MTGVTLTGGRVQLRPIRAEDAVALRVIRSSPEVSRWWGSPDSTAWPFDQPDSENRAVWTDDGLVGYIEWYEHPDPEYRHAGIDIFLAAGSQGRGLGRAAVGLVLDHLVRRGHHRIVIDPAADNRAAIACYSACGFTRVGVMRQYERDVAGEGFHDGLLMEYIVEP